MWIIQHPPWPFVNPDYPADIRTYVWACVMCTYVCVCACVCVHVLRSILFLWHLCFCHQPASWIYLNSNQLLCREFRRVYSSTQEAGLFPSLEHCQVLRMAKNLWSDGTVFLQKDYVSAIKGVANATIGRTTINQNNGLLCIIVQSLRLIVSFSFAWGKLRDFSLWKLGGASVRTRLSFRHLSKMQTVSCIYGH